MHEVYRRLVTFLLALVMAGAEAGHCFAATFAATPRPIRLATTTSTENSGLLGYLLPVFEKKYGAPVRVIAVGTGQALKLGERGDVDVVLVHARAEEDKFVAAQFGIDRRDVMYNDFVMVGPKADPAGIRGFKSVGEAMKKIHQANVKFVSRGDESGTHIMERRLWREENLVPGGENYLSAGQGMGAVLTMAGSLGAYTLSDRGTFVAYKSRIELDILVSGDPRLANPYGIIAVNPQRHPDVNASGAKALIEWITSTEGRERIDGFRVNGEPLFFSGLPPSAGYRVSK